jgi:hypothetical protein
VKNPGILVGKTVEEVAAMLGEGWTQSSYGVTGQGWRFTLGDKIVFYHEGGRHVSKYYGFASGKTGKVKIVGPDYKPLPGDKAKIIQAQAETNRPSASPKETGSKPPRPASTNPRFSMASGAPCPGTLVRVAGPAVAAKALENVLISFETDPELGERHPYAYINPNPSYFPNSKEYQLVIGEWTKVPDPPTDQGLLYNWLRRNETKRVTVWEIKITRPGPWKPNLFADD